ncbi:equatorin [Erinaceus europaeus]|uniref:Equatorin n=1 Tax=Erinaceus europaeus TaxID=9365 RepID=A0ABM3Y3L3_ERIEU|nr:equatorin [Erinaceus europaeus]
MTLMLFIFLSGVLTSKITNLTILQDESDVMPYIPGEVGNEQTHASEQASGQDQVQKEKQVASEESEPKAETAQSQEVTQDPEEGERDDNFDEKNGHSYKDVKHYTFTTKNSNGTDSEVSVRATTDLRFAFKNYKSINGSQLSGQHNPKENPKESPENNLPKSTQRPSESDFWTKLAQAFNQTTQDTANERNELFQPIPSSDVTSAATGNPEKLENTKLKLMLGISLMSLLLFVILLAICSAVLYKMKTADLQKPSHSEYSINPELAAMSYFHPAEGVSDTSFSKSAESSTYWATTSTEVRNSGTGESKSKTDMISTASDEICVADEADLPQSEDPCADFQTEE